MTYHVELSRLALKSFKNLPKEDLRRIEKKIDALSLNPRPNGYKKIEGESNLYRVRSGDYRILYNIFDHKLLVMVIEIGHRRFIYR